MLLWHLDQNQCYQREWNKELNKVFSLAFLLSPYLSDSQPEKAAVRISLGLVRFGIF